MQHSTRVYQARVPFKKKKYIVLEFGKLEYYVIFIFYFFLEIRVPHQFCHRGTTELEFVRLKKIVWFSSLVNSSTISSTM